MVFQTGNIADSTKTLINEYDTKFINDGYSGYQSISWYMNMNKIINVSFKNEISFKTMKYWFKNARNLKYVNYSNFDEVFLLFGKETKGLPEDVLRSHLSQTIRIPMRETIRSLNLSNSVAIVAYEIFKQQKFGGLEKISKYFD